MKGKRLNKMKFWLLFIFYLVIMFCNIQLATLFTIEIYNLSESQGSGEVTNWIDRKSVV